MSYKENLAALRGDLRTVNKTVPEMMAGFGALSKAVSQNEALDAKTQELIALGMAVISRCEPCIMLHVDALRKTGASREELGVVLGLAVQMGGGPALMYASKTLACWDELTAA
ncbi:carboxymuconolactone decarboxylase family protein [Paenirhodobacter enshiensis]|uniref:Alkylhydroperoxidase n=1 Tax=Paenirhodobacter enshiensis TaxID=1105367 RepID=A0A086XSM2_9RHOB|nr:carboxymuconolactone decarboxylase family protein [Paenirhodobacter enshiensis]KFI25022.1 alkylhydroperoxidase [Paenirhodobacter enshiensis]